MGECFYQKACNVIIICPSQGDDFAGHGVKETYLDHKPILGCSHALACFLSTTDQRLFFCLIMYNACSSLRMVDMNCRGDE